MNRASRWGVAVMVVLQPACGGSGEVAAEPIDDTARVGQALEANSSMGEAGSGSAALSTRPLYQDPRAPLAKRVRDLVGRMTLAEKISQTMNDAPAIPRLEIPAYNWWNECLHGVARAGRATVFPQPIGTAATWDAALVGEIARVISDEARAKYHEFQRRGKREIYQGLTFWTPNINLFRDPRWGRGMETYGEDPYLMGTMGVQFIKGLQGDDPRYLKTVATAKHYAVHSGPESDRHTFDARASDVDLWTSYLPHFEAAVREGHASSVMCAYNRFDGQPACASDRLLGQILRAQWDFSGYVVSDCGAIGDIQSGHKVESTLEGAAARAMNAGCDLNCGVEYSSLSSAFEQGLVAESAIDRAVQRLFAARFQLGMFDPPELVPFHRIPYQVNDSPQHDRLALEASRKSIVLLKNARGLLPLSKHLRTIAVIGPNADDPAVLLGNYNGQPTRLVTPLEGIRRKVSGRTRVLYAPGADIAENMPTLQTVPSSALFTSTGTDRQNGLVGEYYATSNFNGRAYRPTAFAWPNWGETVGDIPASPTPWFTRIDRTVDYDWWEGAPRPDLDDDNFGVRWSGFLVAPTTGTYYLGATGMNAFELYFNEQQLVAGDSIHLPPLAYAKVDLEAGRAYPIRLDFHQYFQDANIRLVWSVPNTTAAEDALAAARRAEASIMFLGLSPRLEGEEMNVAVPGFSGGDRLTLDLPAPQQQLLEQVSALGKPVVVVLLNGSALSIGWAQANVPAIVEAWYGGQAAGTAIADVLFGDYNPAGRLPVTFYQSVDQLPAFTNYDMKERTYRYFSGKPLFPFGYGLSYTTFAYGAQRLPAEVRVGEPVVVSVEITNSGRRAGEEVVELYLTHLQPEASEATPIRELAGFRRIALGVGETRRVEFTVTPRQLARFREGRWVVSAGAVEIAVGGKQPGFEGAADAATTGVTVGTVKLVGDPEVLAD